MTTITSTESGAAGRFINLGSSANLDDKVKTVIAYCRPTGASSGSAGYLYAKTTSGQPDGPRLYQSDNGGAPLVAGGDTSNSGLGDPNVAGVSNSVPYNSWYHITYTNDLTFSSGAIKVYVNNVDQSGTAIAGGVARVTDATNDVFLMNRGDSGSLGREFVGDVAYWALYDTVLDSTQRANVAANGPLTEAASLICVFANDTVYHGVKDPGNLVAVTARSTRVTGALPPNTALGDTTVPTLTGSMTVGTVTANSIAVTWPTGTDNVAVTSYEVSSNNGSSYTDTGSTSTGYTFTGLTPSTSYTLRVRAKDAAGNVSTPALSVTQSTSAGSDTTVPVLTGSITVGTVTTTSIAVTWPTGTDNVAVTSYEVSSNNGSSYTDTGSTSTGYTFTGLTPSTSYTLRVRAKDAAGNVSTPALSATQSTNAPATGTFTSEPLKYNNGTLQASVTLNYVALYNDTTNVLVVKKTAVPVNGSGIFTITDALIVAGTTYRVDWETAGGQRRMPRKAAT